MCILTMLVVAQDGALSGQAVGYANIWYQEAAQIFIADGYVHPLYRRRGIGKALLTRVENRALQQAGRLPPGAPLLIRNTISGKDKAAIQLHENLGYYARRYYWRMEIEMQTPPETPLWPAGISVRAFNPGQDERPVFEALDEAFADHWGHAGWVYEPWRRRMYGEGYDPGLYFVAEDGQAGQSNPAPVAGAALCCYRGQDGWVQTMGVRRPWRQRGLGLALLLHALGEFYRRGTRNAGLGVDAQNPTGATRLYQRAGMHMAHEYILYEKRLES